MANVAPRAALALVALVTGAAVAACGTATTHDARAGAGTSTPPAPSSTSTSPGPSSSPSDDAPAAATGARLATTAFTLHLPPHWMNSTGDAPAGVLALGANPGDDLVEQIVVKRTADGRPAASLHADGATHVRTEPSARIDGRPADHASGVGGTRAARTAVDRYTVTAGRATWQVTFSLNRWAHRADRERLIGSVLASWSWR